MKKIAVILLIAILSVFMMQCDKRENPVMMDIPHGLFFDGLSLTSQAILGNVMQDFPNRDVVVYTPAGYDQADTTTFYPVLYLLHGYGGDQNYWRAVYGLGNTLDRMIYDGEIEPMLVVTANAINSLGGSFYTNSPPIDSVGGDSFAGNYEDFIIDELIPLVDNTFNTMADREHRAIAGSSMGGYGALKLSMSHPEMFCATGSMSGPIAFWGSVPAGGDFPGLLLLLDAVYAENGFTPGDLESFNTITPGAGKRLTGMMFAMGAAFSPTLESDTLMDFAHAFATPLYSGYINLPFNYMGEVPAMDTAFTSPWDRWMQNDVTAIMAGRAGFGLETFENIAVYVDAGAHDDIGLYGHAEVFAGAMNSYVGRYPDFYEIYPDIGDNYPADHSSLYAARLPYLFSFINDNFGE